MNNFYDDDENSEEPIPETGEHDLGDDIGERIGKDDSSDNLPI